MTGEIQRNTRTERCPGQDVRNGRSRLWMWAIILLGLGLRVFPYLTRRSLWLDEALLALNVLHRTAGGLFRPLDYHQGAPIGFLLLEKLATGLAGHGELALRAFPLLCGAFALVFFWPVARLYVSRPAVPIALSLFAFCGSLIYYSSEAKQYSGDVLVTVVLLWLLSRLACPAVSTRAALGLSLIGSVAIWFSHPATFLLSGAGLALLLFALGRHDWPHCGRLALACGMWAASFLVCYSVSLHALSRDQALLDFWRPYFPARPFSVLQAASFLVDRFFEAFSDPGRLVSIVGAPIFVLGCCRLARRNKVHFWVLTTPLLVTLAAAFLHKYPFGGRFLLFALPILFLIIGEGAASIAEASARYSLPVKAALLVLLLTKPVWADVQALAHPIDPEDARSAILYAKIHQLPGDVWYVYHWARFQYWYYSETYDVRPASVIIGADCGSDVECNNADLDRLRGYPRVWVVFSHIWTGDGVSEEAVFLEHLDRLGVRRDSYRSTGARAYLYDLSQSAATPEK